MRAPPAPLPYVPKYLNASLTGTNYAMDFACLDSTGAVSTCSPAFCASSTGISSANTALACPFTGPATVNYQQQVSLVTARSCTASTDSRCSSAWLAATFGVFPQVLAAYCNDK